MSLLSRPSRTINIPIPQLPLLLVSPPLASLYPTEGKKNATGGEERGRLSLINGAQSPLCFPIPRSSANVDCGRRRGCSRVFAPPCPGIGGAGGGRVNTLIDALNGERTRRRTRGERGREIGRKKGGGKLDSIEREPRG